MTDELGLSSASLVVEVASNDGYLLQHFAATGIGVLGVEPATEVAEVARARGLPTEVVFLGEVTGQRIRDEHGPADLVVGNNVYAHVPDVGDFSLGLRRLVADDGLVTLEFPHLLRLIENRQVDTIYHEHYQYWTLATATRALAQADLQVVDVDELGTHGGSLRVHARPGAGRPVAERVAAVLAAEEAAGLHRIEGYRGFATEVAAVKRDLLDFLIAAARAGRTVAGWRPGQGQHPAQPLRDPDRPAAVHGGPQPGQARTLLPGQPDPHPAGRDAGRRAAGLRPDHAAGPEGDAGSNLGTGPPRTRAPCREA